MAGNEIIVEFGEKGAGFVFDQIKKVSRSVDEVRSKMKAPIGGEMTAEMFGVKAMQQATGSLHALGIEYEKTRGKMKSPLMSPESMMSVDSFTKKGFTKDLKSLNDELGNTGKKAQNAGAHLGFVSRILAAMAIRAVAREVYEMANAFTTLQNKIKTVADEGSVNFITKELFQIAQGSRASLESVATAYSRTTRSVASLGKSQQEVLQFTDNLSKAILVGGSTAIEASNAMIQLSQGMGSGALRGDELRSVLEQLPIVAELIADKLGVPISALRKLGAEGKISTEVIFDAINAGQPKIDEMVQKMSITVPQAWQKFKNAAVMASEGAQGAMGALAQVIEYVTNNMETFITIFAAAAAMITTVFVARAMSAAIAALASLVTSLTAATAAQTGLNLATLANPYVLAAAAIATVVAGLAVLTSGLKIAEGSTVTFGDVWVGVWDEVKAAFSGNEVSDGIKTVDASVTGLSESMMELARATDLYIGGHTFENLANRINMNAENKETDRMLKEEGDVMAADMSLDPGTAKNSVLKSADDFIKEVYDRVDTLEEAGTKGLRVQKKLFKTLNGMDPAIRDSMSIDQLDSLRKGLEREDDLTHKKSGREKKDPKTFNDILTQAQNDEFAAGMDEKELRIMKKAQSLLDQLDAATKKALTAGQLTELDTVVRNEEAIIAGKKAEEEMYKAGIEYADKLHKRKLEHEKDLAKEREERSKKDFDIAASLDPSIGVGVKVRELEEFEKRMSHIPELAQKARDKIRELKDELDPDGFTAFIKNFEDIGQNLKKGFSDTVAEIVIMNHSLRETKALFADLAQAIAKQALSRAIETTIDVGIKGLTSAATSSAGGSTATLPGGSSGGYTGDIGIDKAAAIVHGQEYVINASSTKSIGKDTLAYMNKTGNVPASGEKPAAAPTVNVHNYAGVQVDTSVSKGEINIMIDRAIREKTPGLVAQEVHNPNSRTSRSLQRNLETERRRR